MSWTAITEEEIWTLIVEAEGRMSPPESRLWEIIKVMPHKWQQDPFGNLGGGFWVVGIIGTSVLWYNDIEGGFNISCYKAVGAIAEYWCNQDDLEHSVHQLLQLIQSGASPIKCDPPQAI